MFEIANEWLTNRHLKSRPDLFKKRYPEEYQKIISTTPSELPWGERLYRYIYEINENPTCETCGKPTKFQNFSIGYARFCTPGCASKNPNIKKTKQETCMKHYGVDNPSKSSSIQSKKINTSNLHYGVDNPTQCEEIIAKIHKTKLEKYGDPNYNNSEKIKNTNLEKYGVEYFTQTPGFHEASRTIKEERYGDPNYNNPQKTKKTCRERYGVDTPIQCEEIITKMHKTKLEKYGDPNYNNPEKTKKTNLEKYGTEYAIGSEHVRSRIKKSMIEKYGVDNMFRTENFYEKSKQTNIDKYGYEYAVQNPEVRKKLSQSLTKSWSNRTKSNRDKFRLNLSKASRPVDVIESNINDSGIIYTCSCPHPECTVCDEKTYQIPANIHSNRVHQKIELCTKLYPIQYNRISNTSLERFITGILDEYSIEYITNDRSILAGKELDIYIPDLNLAIECNGVYWHSLKSKSYHYNKWKICKDKGIQLLTIWEDQIKTKPDIIKGIVESRLGIYKERFYARKCVIKSVCSIEANKFLKMNHLQGSVNGAIRIGLYYMDELVSLMIFGRKRKALGSENASDIYELYRYCNKLGVQVVGGASRLFDHFIKEHPGCRVESFSSNDISMGELYNILGFGLESEQKGSYWYIDNEMNRHHRYSFRKDILVKNGADPSLTEFQITDEMGLYRIYDSGQQKWIFNPTSKSEESTRI